MIKDIIKIVKLLWKLCKELDGKILQNIIQSASGIKSLINTKMIKKTRKNSDFTLLTKTIFVKQNNSGNVNVKKKKKKGI